MDSLSKGNLFSLVEKFQGRKVLVVGDLMVSRFVEVSARKLAREAPVPAGDYVGETLLPGGAANLSRELASLGASVSLIGLVGEDEHGVWLKSDLERKGVDMGGVVVEKSRPTSLRTWIMVNRLHYLRIDRESRKDVPLALTKRFMDEVQAEIAPVDCVVLSDYDRGVVTPQLISGVVAEARERGKIVVAQPKDRHYLDLEGVTYVKSNLEEVTHATGMHMVNETTLRNLGVNVLSRLNCKGLIVTRGEEGMTVFDGESVTNFPPLAGKRSFFNKVGVRDAMTGVFALAVSSGGSVHEAACLSNVAGALRSDMPRNVSLTAADIDRQIEVVGDFLQSVVQAPVRR